MSDPSSVRIGGVYRHFKGNRYRVIAIAKHSESMEELVVYQALYGEGTVYARPIAMWNASVSTEGGTVPRFALLDEPTDAQSSDL